MNRRPHFFGLRRHRVWRRLTFERKKNFAVGSNNANKNDGSQQANRICHHDDLRVKPAFSSID